MTSPLRRPGGPPISVDYDSLQAERFLGTRPGPFGVVASVTLAQSVDPEKNRRASSGGATKELLAAYLECDDVDTIIALCHVGGLDSQPMLVDSVDEVETLPGSIYHNLLKHRVLELLREKDARFVLVGIPCEFERIINYISKVEPHLDARIHSIVGLLWGGVEAQPSRLSRHLRVQGGRLRFPR